MPSKARLSSLVQAATPLVAALFVSSCQPAPPLQRVLAEGVTLREDPQLGITTVVLDRDLAAFRPMVVAENVTRIRNNLVGDAFTAAEWARKRGALVAINGGFFGETYDTLGRRKQLVQLAMVEGRVVAPGTVLASREKKGDKYVRSAVGFDADGNPMIEWATGDEAHGLRAWDRATQPARSTPWEPESAVAGGPRLIHRGKVLVTEKQEHMGNREAATRLCVAYNDRYLVFCRAESQTYRQLAELLLSFFRTTLQSAPTEALCLDGGPSAQLAVQEGSGWRDTTPTGVQVPTAVLLVPKSVKER